MEKDIFKKLEEKHQEYLSLTKELDLFDEKQNISLKIDLLKKQSLLLPFEDAYHKFLHLKNLIKNYEQEIEQETSTEFSDLLKKEKNEVVTSFNNFLSDIKNLFLSKINEDDYKNVIVEIRGATGGDEANIFANDLFEMYLNYANKNHWKVEIIEVSKENDGISHAFFTIKGKNVYKRMKFESGVHRVQRIPKTESKGRVHTSTATVAILPEINEIKIKINPSDLKIDTYRASGAGGQHVNTTDSAVRITHIPTNTVVTSQDERSQHENKRRALKVLESKIYFNELEKQEQEIYKIRKVQIKLGKRSDKIRTYNFARNQVIDHRFNVSLNRLDEIMNGNLDEFIDQLNEIYEKKALFGDQ
ncbi:peptide chain release factor 1 [symbiont of Argiope bruennichi]|uniref:peptide chain release factor 1 n=1 Tax=symbiont of Argiope bruennichi TaxID=2810479 RepID=UPI003DA5EA92